MKAIETSEAPSAVGPYSQAIQTGNTLYCSGQIPIDPKTGEILNSTIKKETELVMTNLAAVLRAANTSFDEVVKMTIFLDNMDNFGEVNEVYSSFLKEPYPARACVQAAKLPKGVRVEIDAIANVP